MADIARRTPLLIAIVVASVGAGLLIREVIPFPLGQSAAGRERVERPPSALEQTVPIFSLPVAPTLDVVVNKDSISTIEADIRDRIASVSRATPQLSGLGLEQRSALSRDASEQFAIYLVSDFDRYHQLLERTGAKYEIIDRVRGDAEQLRAMMEDVRSFWSNASAPIAFRPISLEHLTARLRAKDGVVTPHRDDQFVSAVTNAPERWPRLMGDPAANRLTIVEVVLPVTYFLEPSGGNKPVVTPAYFGIWFVWDNSSKDWKVHQFRLYNPLKAPIGLVPCP